MKKSKRKTLCASTKNTAQANTQHYKLHIHENDHRFIFDHRLNSILSLLTILSVLTFCKSK